MYGLVMTEYRSQQIVSHAKSMGIFQNIQGQLTLHSVMESGQYFDSFEILWLFIEEDLNKNVGAGVLTCFFPYKV